MWVEEWGVKWKRKGFKKNVVRVVKKGGVAIDWKKFERQNRSEKEIYVYVWAGGSGAGFKGIFLAK